jgi:hypothetical protein
VRGRDSDVDCPLVRLAAHGGGAVFAGDPFDPGGYIGTVGFSAGCEHIGYPYVV